MLSCWGHVYSIPLASPLLPFVGLRRFEVFLKPLNDALKLSTFQGLSTSGTYVVTPYLIRNRSSLKGPQGGKDHDEFVPAARALDRQRYF